MECNGARIFVVDDHPAVRQGLALLLGADAHMVCGEAASKAEALQCLVASRPQLTLLDISLGEDNGLDLIGWLLQHEIRVLVYSMHEDIMAVEGSFRLGAQGYVSKREDSRVLLSGVREVLAGRRFISPRGAQVLAGRAIASSRADWLARLSERELQIMDMLGQGCSNAEIAKTLMISVRTVESYCTRIMEKLQLSGMKELRQQAILYRN